MSELKFLPDITPIEEAMISLHNISTKAETSMKETALTLESEIESVMKKFEESTQRQAS